MTALADIDKLIETAKEREPNEKYIPTRYPYTYAYDYVRGHWNLFGPSFRQDQTFPSRGEVAGMMHDLLPNEDDRVAAIKALANAYMDEHHIEP